MTKSRQQGFTLIELIIFIVVVSAGLAGILLVINTVVKSSADPMVRKQTVAIAESLLEEILLKEYAKPDGSTVAGYGATGWSRSQFDCVDDYNNYTTSTGIVDMLGSSVGLGSYNITPPVTVAAATLGSLTVKKITVKVTGPGGEISLSGYRSNY
jgi:MSHA pilin protein MshD